MLKLLAVLVLAFVTLGGFALWLVNRPDGDLQTLRAEQIRKYVPTGAAQGEHYEADRPKINIFGGHSAPANLTQRFSSCPPSCFQELLERARNDGWLKFPGVEIRPDWALFYKPYGSRHLTLGINAQDANKPSEASIVLTYQRGRLVPFGT